MTRPTEDELIARYLAPLAGTGALGLRDDAAVVSVRPGRDLIITKDMLVAGVHFFPDDPPETIARKALRVNLSDLAAKGAEPTGFLLGLALPETWWEAWLAAFCVGLKEDIAIFACPLLGGDTTSTAGPLTLSITAFGEVPTGGMVPRAAARAGDSIYVSGTIGDAALGLKQRNGGVHRIDAVHAAHLRQRYLIPEPRLALRAAMVYAHAAMDISDGLVGDLTKFLALAGLTADIAVDAVPLSAAAHEALAHDPTLIETIMTGGDDYELLCAVGPAEAQTFEAAARDAGVPVARIGAAITGDTPLVVRDRSGTPLRFAGRSYQHFA